jgi:hypothetical protein
MKSNGGDKGKCRRFRVTGAKPHEGAGVEITWRGVPGPPWRPRPPLCRSARSQLPSVAL